MLERVIFGSETRLLLLVFDAYDVDGDYYIDTHDAFCVM
jgi:hypothetical protein